MNQTEWIINRLKTMKTDRGTLESHLQEILRFCNPRKATVTYKGTPGEKRGFELFDGTAINALDILAAGMNTFLTSRVNKWFVLETEDIDLMEDRLTSEWLQDSERRMYRMFGKSNFYNAIHESYLDDGSIGTSILYAEDDQQDLCRFFTRHISECFISENNKERVDTVFREFSFTARQAWQEFGKKAGDDIKKFLEKEPDKPIKFLHAVFPRADRDPRKADKLSMPFASVYLLLDKNIIIDESGYHELPYMVTRWTKETGEVYGRSAAMNALPDTKMVNKMGESTIRVAQKSHEPPLIVPDDGMLGRPKLVPGGLTYVRADYMAQGIEPRPFKITGNPRLGLEIENQRREAIRQFFYVDLFLLLLNRPTMTATEVLERNEEKLAILSPIVGREMTEKLNPTITRSFGIMLRRGAFRTPPPALRGQNLSIRYISTIAKAQQLYEANAIRNTIADLAPAAQIMPEVWDNINPDMLFDEIADLRGLPQRVRRTPDQIKAIRDTRSKTAQEETDKEDLMQGVGAAAQAKKSGLLDEVMGSA